MRWPEDAIGKRLDCAQLDPSSTKDQGQCRRHQTKDAAQRQTKFRGPMHFPLADCLKFAIGGRMRFFRPLALLFSGLLAMVLPSCESVPPEVAARNAVIATEPRGDYYIGRRYHVDTTRFWGYLREPGQPWSTARLVVMNEARVKLPDRLPESPADGSVGHGFDNNREYRINGRYTGRGIYDPNSNLMLPEFLLTGIVLSNPSPGWLFSPRDSHKSDTITIYPPGGIKQWPQ